jgi:microcystin-dependent protein
MPMPSARITQRSGETSVDVFIGTIMIFAGNFEPAGWAFCNGQILPIQQNAALFSILGTTYGGNGTTNFALPNLQGRAPIHFGQGVGLSLYQLGETLGAEQVALTIPQIPSHSHLVTVNAGAATTDQVSNAFLANSGTAKPYAPTVTSAATLNTQVVQPAGANLPHENRQPLIAMNYIIALTGLFPSRG